MITPPILATPEILALVAAGAPVAWGVSGGKDGVAMAGAGTAWLNALGHAGPRVLIHADLGRIEWRASLPTCERLAERLGLELVVVRRKAGDMVDRWLGRWAANVARYAALECVKLILPWSTPSMRFCTSELKTTVICRELVRRFAGQTIISAAGLRRDESAKRRLAPIAKAQNKLASVTHATTGLDWHPILDWTKPDVFAYIAAAGLPLHPAYALGSSRVSCAFCIMSNQADLLVAAAQPENQDVYRELVELEIVSTFGLQSPRWLGDVAPQLLTGEQLAGLAEAKRRAAERERIESQIPAHLLYSAGWPTSMPTHAEAALLARVRREIAALMEIEVRYTDAAAVLGRYAELMAARPAGAPAAAPRQLAMELAA